MTLLSLREAMADADAFKRLCHADRVTAPLAIALLPQHRCHLAPSCLRELANTEGSFPSLGGHSMLLPVGGFERLLEDTQSMAQQLGRPLPRFESVEHIKATHDGFVAACRAITESIEDVLPPPPVALTPEEALWVKPLTTCAAMRREGQKMHHCLGVMVGHHRMAREGRFYAWALHDEQRHTLAFFQRGGRWHLYDLKRECNQPADDRVVTWARMFLLRANAGVSSGRQMNLMEEAHAEAFAF